MSKNKPAKFATFDACLEAVDDDKRVALEKLRGIIHTLVPTAEECVSYGLPAFRLDGKPLVAIGATANHCAFYLMSGSIVAAHQDELKKYDTSKGTIRFPADKPLPLALVRKLVKARIAEKDGNSGKARKPRVAAARRMADPETGNAQADPTVIAFLKVLDHSRKQQVESVRQIILGVSPEIREAIKWNSPSFRTTDYFATINLHGKDGIRLILHTGAKKKESATKGLKIADPSGLLEWLAKDRCLVTLGDAKDIQAKRAALAAIVREWIRQM